MIGKLLIANRGEIAVRIARTGTELGIASVAVYSEDDAEALHVRRSDEAVALKGTGPAAYLDAAQIVEAAKSTGCEAVHPGYGFLSENAAFAEQCEQAGLIFIGPAPEQLRLFGDKARARALAQACGVPVLSGTAQPATVEEAAALLGTSGAIMLKAVAGGGGRGIRRIDREDELAPAFELCQSEAWRAFGNGALYAEQFLPRARHIEVQIAGDGTGAVSHLWDRECSLQRRHQKIVEIAPAVAIPEALREKLFAAALAMAGKARYRNLGTFEFLIAGDAFYFIEANPRLQVEHTVTEEVTGLDLVALQIGLANGRSLEALGIAQATVPPPRGIAIQVRVNMETMQADGSVRPAGGTLSVYEPPTGPGVRVDGFGYTGYRTGSRFDSLLAKVIVHMHAGVLGDAVRKAVRALGEFRIAGVPTNIGWLQRVLALPDVQDGQIHTQLLEEQAATLSAGDTQTTPTVQIAGSRIDRNDPLAILGQGFATVEPDPNYVEPVAPEGTVPLRAPIQGAIVSITAKPGDLVAAGAQVLIMEAMKMEHVVIAAETGIIREFTVAPGDAVFEAAVLAFVEPRASHDAAHSAAASDDLDAIRPDLAELKAREALRYDRNREKAVARRHDAGQRTARENIDDLCDAESFVEYGGLAIAARRTRSPVEELLRTTPADGLITGTARVNGTHFTDDRARCAVLSYDPTVFAGTQGFKGHEKMDRMLELAGKSRLPVVFFTEGGGGRPGDTDKLGVGFNFIKSFSWLGALSGLVPIVGVNNSRCFAGNAFILGCCDVIIATKSSTIGIGGPALVEGAGLGAYKAEEIGPAAIHGPNGVIDVLVDDEPAAVAAAKKYLSYFQGPLGTWSEADQRELRNVVPENHRRVYDMRKLIAIVADTGSVLELRPQFGAAMITAFVRVEGRPIGVIANNPHHLGGAIDAPASDKATRFMQLCEAFDIPLLSLIDTPGYMVGPEAEKTALIRHCARMTVVGSNLTVPWIALVVRKGYGMGGLAMAGGSFSNCIMTAAWPTGEFGGMAIEGYVKLGFRDQLAAIADLDARKAKYEEMVARMYDESKAVNAATFYEFDDVIDPLDTRRRIVEALRSAPPAPPRDGKKLSWIDAW
ncbi:MAG TPA: carboxyl transferase domain-containing protein [Rhizomicrobium sp.]|jgi:acetyl/propionyl-CoA carboxylase alpha subunit/acetyl-CoA carboxylase carboxyltransferase component